MRALLLRLDRKRWFDGNVAENRRRTLRERKVALIASRYEISWLPEAERLRSRRLVLKAVTK